MNYYCTLFDSYYLIRGLAMYQSLKKVGEDFTLFIFSFDELSFEILKILKLSNVVVIKLEEFETMELLQVKKNRSKAEYCWTCTPHIISHVIEKFAVNEITYIDADLYFFANPEILLQEFRSSKKDVMITEHRYTDKYDQSETSGIYCVQFMTFKNTTAGNIILQWWKDRCIEWCYARFEDGKFGDQKYLDDWTTRFKAVHVLQHLGGGVAPWNVQQYLVCNEKVNDTQLIFYHYHGLTWNKKFTIFYPALFYELSTNVVQYIYMPYVKELEKSLNFIQKNYDASFHIGYAVEPTSFMGWLRACKAKWRGRKNVIRR